MKGRRVSGEGLSQRLEKPRVGWGCILEVPDFLFQNLI